MGYKCWVLVLLLLAVLLTGCSVKTPVGSEPESSGVEDSIPDAGAGTTTSTTEEALFPGMEEPGDTTAASATSGPQGGTTGTTGTSVAATAGDTTTSVSVGTTTATGASQTPSATTSSKDTPTTTSKAATTTTYVYEDKGEWKPFV